MLLKPANQIILHSTQDLLRFLERVLVVVLDWLGDVRLLEDTVLGVFFAFKDGSHVISQPMNYDGKYRDLI